MNESQLKSLVRQAFALQNAADRAVLDTDLLLGRVMLQVKRLVETLPEESLLRQKSWRELSALIKQELAPYAQVLRQAVYREQGIAWPGMADYAAREARYAGAKLIPSPGAPSSPSVVAAVDRALVGKATFKRLFTPKRGGVSPYVESMYNVVNKRVQTGILKGLTTKQIADEVVHETILRGVPGVSLNTNSSVRTIRAQAMAMSRTITQDVQFQVKKQFWNENRDALEGFVYQWSATLDSRTCQTCAPLDGKRYDKEADAPALPVHVNCRCDLLLIDREDEFWNESNDMVGTQVTEKKTDRSMSTKVKVKGEMLYREKVQFKGDDYADYLASSNATTQKEFFGGGRAGEARRRIYRSRLKRGDSPQAVLESMLTGPTSARKFIPVND